MEWTIQTSQGCLFQTEMFWFYSEKMFLPLALIAKFISP